jgi:hypothetical protein
VGQQDFDHLDELLKMSGQVCASKLQGGANRFVQECRKILGRQAGNQSLDQKVFPAVKVLE